MTAEGSLEEMAADVARLQELGKESLSREEALVAVVEASKNTAHAKDKQLEANEEALEAVREELAGKSAELSALHEEFEEVRLKLSEGEKRLENAEKMLKEEVERLQAAEEDVAVGKGTVQGLENEVESLEEKVVGTKKDLAAAVKEIAAARDEVKEVEERLRCEYGCLYINNFVSQCFTSIAVYLVFVHVSDDFFRGGAEIETAWNEFVSRRPCFGAWNFCLWFDPAGRVAFMILLLLLHVRRFDFF